MDNIKNKVIEEIKKIYDPEIPVNIYDLGLIYKVEVDEKNKINIVISDDYFPINKQLLLWLIITYST